MHWSHRTAQWRAVFNRYVRYLSRPALPSDWPAPFVCARNLDEVRETFQRTGASERSQVSPDGQLHGYCEICQKAVAFEVERPPGGGEINWRETVKCPCGLINRWRGCLHLFKVVCKPTSEDRIYITESLSPVKQQLEERFSRLVSSEYVDNAQPGETVTLKSFEVRNEDVTRLSFESRSFDALLTFDVLEHVPQYRKALREFHRVLDFGGRLILTVPFNFQNETSVRAVLTETGEIRHLMEPCYHGDPISDQGVLAYYDFGMDLLEQFSEAGFRDCCAVCYQSDYWGYPSPNIAFVAVR